MAIQYLKNAQSMFSSEALFHAKTMIPNQGMHH
jgi:hypothetical protein